MEMPESFTVFVCSTFADLGEERDRVLDAIRRMKLKHDSMEFFGARSPQPIEACLEEVHASDVLVVIVGHEYGSLVPGRQMSFSEAEYEEGFRLKKPCLVYVRDENVPVMPKHMERDPEKLKLLEAWKATLQARHTVASFEDDQRLAVQVAADLGRVLVETSKKLNKALAETSQAKGVPEAPLREVLKRLGETEVAEAEIPDRLAKAADELLRLRADLARLTNDPKAAAIRARASTLLDKGDFDAARAALNEGFEIAAKHRTWPAEATQHERDIALEKASARRKLYEGAEILWVDDRPSNNVNEARMLRSFGAVITFAVTTDEARAALKDAMSQARPFHIILSDMARDLPPPRNTWAGLEMLHVLRAEGIQLPVIFYVGVPVPNAPVPEDAFGITHRPDISPDARWGRARAWPRRIRGQFAKKGTLRRHDGGGGNAKHRKNSHRRSRGAALANKARNMVAFGPCRSP
jgi:CheY-like chemotaxis protein